MEISSKSRVRCCLSDKFVNAVLDDDQVFMDVAEGEFYGLRETGRRTWQLIEEGGETGKLVEELTAALCAEFKVDEEKCRRDLAVLLAELQAAGLVELS